MNGNAGHEVLSRPTRLWIYGIVIAGLGVLVGYDVIVDGQAELWQTLVMAVLGITGAGVATVNVPSKDAGMPHKGA